MCETFCFAKWDAMIARHIKNHKRRRRHRTIVYREKQIFIDFRLFICLFVCLEQTFAPFFNYILLSFLFGFLFTHTLTNAFIAVIAEVLLCLCIYRSVYTVQRSLPANGQ